MLRRLALAAIRANPLLTLGVALELGYRAARRLRRSTQKARCTIRPASLKPRFGRGPDERGESLRVERHGFGVRERLYLR